MDNPIWKQRSVVQWCHRLLASYRHWTGRELIEPVTGLDWPAETLFRAPLVVVSHGNEPDPLLNYGNQQALELWEMAWEQFVATPSRMTAEPVDRAERQQMLTQADTMGYISNYRGVRISKTGRRFLIERAIVWNVIDLDLEAQVDATGRRLGQAAAFSEWRVL